jgi:hypothetical protein
MNYTIGLCIIAAIACYACVHVIRGRIKRRNAGYIEIPSFLRADNAGDNSIDYTETYPARVCRFKTPK